MQHPTSENRRIYLDNAATSWPKPEAVYRAVDRYQRLLGAPAGRSGYAEAIAVSQEVDAARARVARFVGLDQPRQLIFTANGTDSLNLAIHGLLRQGHHVVTTAIEHNSVLRPLEHLAADGRITVTQVSCDGHGIVDPDEVRRAVRGNTRLVAISHASNVTGAIQPIAEIARVAREAGALTLCDAAQSLGHLPLDVSEMGIDLLAAAGHKGLLGPLGTGVLAIGPRAIEHLDSVRQGGTGTESQLTAQPNELPAKFESGNLNVPGILGLGAGVAFLEERGLDALEREGRRLTARLLTAFSSIEGLRVLGPPQAQSRVPLVSIVLEGYDPQEVALSLDAIHRIQVRAGLHCAPAMHASLGTIASGGTVRFSLGPFTTDSDIDAAVEAMAEMAASASFDS
jgi:cysteine desulfurase/selenocysteine lyase